MDLTIAGDILALTKPHISEYSRFGLLLSSKARRLYAATASVLGIASAKYTIGVKYCLFLLVPGASEDKGVGSHFC